jgi:peptide deformylase
VIRDIVQLGDPTLRQRAHKVRDHGPGLQRLVTDLLDSMESVNGAGLAAPQIGVPLRVIVTNVDEGPLVFVNPEIKWRSKETWVANEGCLSIRGYVGPVERAERVEVRAQDEHGKKIKVRAEEWFARCLQHEIDHLDGILYIDHIEDKSLIRAANEDFEVEPDPIEADEAVIEFAE